VCRGGSAFSTPESNDSHRPRIGRRGTLFAGFAFPDFFDFGIEIGVVVTEKSARGKERPSPVALRKASFRVQQAKNQARGDDSAAPAARRARAGRRIVRQRAHVDIFADFFDVNSQAMFTAIAISAYLLSGYVELKRARILRGCEARLAGGCVLETDSAAGIAKYFASRREARSDNR